MRNLIYLLAFSALSAGASPVVLLGNPKSNINLPDEFASTVRIDSSVQISDDRANVKAYASDEWEPIGEGTYRDVLFSDLFGKEPQTFKVKFEHSKSDPTLYRIPNVYENMDFSDYGGYLTYNASAAEPMVFHIFYDEYAFFDEFDTGVYSTYTTPSKNYTGEIRMLMQGTDLLYYNDLNTLIYYLPECLIHIQDGNLFLDSTFYLESRSWSNLLGICYVTGTSSDTLITGNQSGNFYITMPDASEYDPNADWTDIGNAIYTDVFTELVNPNNPPHDTWEVPMQQSISDPRHYRLVNPYKDWKYPGVTYDTKTDHYLELYIKDYDGFSLVGIPIFDTGLDFSGYGRYYVWNEVADLVKNNIDSYLELYYSYMGCLGLLQDGVITYAPQCLIDYDLYYNFFGYFNRLDFDYGEFYEANTRGDFRIVMPDNSGLTKIDHESLAVEYYNLQGVKLAAPQPGELVIRKQGSKITKIIF